MSTSWYNLPSPEIEWLVDGLITSDGHCAIVGKPKSGKSSLIRNLIAAVIKSTSFLGRSIDIPAGTGRVSYVHLDRKDQPHRVAAELRQLGITKEESTRVSLRTAEDLPESFEERLLWIKKEIASTNPHLIVVDLLWQFININNANDYNLVLKGINDLQDALTEEKYKGALVVALHGRKANNPNEPFDDMLGSTGQRGSFGTNIMLARYRKEGVYTIQSDQTERDEAHGELRETIIERSLDGGVLSLGKPFVELALQEKESKAQASLERLVMFVAQHPGCETAHILQSLGISKKTVLKLLDSAPDMFITTGEGKRGDPLRYSINCQLEGQTQASTTQYATN
jgi:hypothetical protein